MIQLLSYRFPQEPVLRSFARLAKRLTFVVLLLLAGFSSEARNEDHAGTAVSDTTFQAFICAGESYVFGDSVLTSAGTYSQTFTSPDGADSTVTVILEVGALVETYLEATLCAGETYVFNGDTLAQGGTYKAYLQQQNGCDSTVILALTVLPLNMTMQTAEICTGTTYSFNGEVLDSSGIYSVVLQGANGCDSIVVLKLTVAPYFEKNQVVNLCTGESYLFGNDTLQLPGIYVDSLTAIGGCDSIIILHLQVNPVKIEVKNLTLCNGVLVVFQGDTLSASGTYTDTLTTVAGCDSILILNLKFVDNFETTIEASICGNEIYPFGGQWYNQSGTYIQKLTATGGCDSLVVLHLTVHPLTDPQDVFASICPGETYDFNGAILDTSGIYSATLVDVNGCDSVVTLHLTVLQPDETSITATICAGSSYTFDGQTLTTEGEYVGVFENINGCDSTVYLHLTVLPTFLDSVSAVICNGETYQLGGAAYADNGTYTAILSAQNGCDSVVVLTLTVLPAQESYQEATICAGENYPFYGLALSQSGNYTATLNGANGCDSTIYLALTVLPTTTSQVEAVICEGGSFEYNGASLTDAGSYTFPFEAANGCDSIVTLTLTVLPVSHAEINAVVCEGTTYLFENQLITSSGTYTETLIAANGCDSVITLSIQFVPYFQTALEATICAGESYTFAGADLAESGIYTDSLTAIGGCDSLVVFTLHVLPTASSTTTATICANETFAFNGAILNTTGTYSAVLAASNGCDSTAVLNLEVLPVTESHVAITICSNETYVFNGETLSTGGTYQSILTGENGCDSTVYLALTVLEAPKTAQEVTICANESYDFYGESLSIAGTYYAVFTAENGCDSTIILTLHVLGVPVTHQSASICAGTAYTFDGQILTTSGTYTATLTAISGCDSLVVLDLLVADTLSSEFSATICKGTSFEFAGAEYTQPGDYTISLQAQGGCDSLVVLHLNVLPAVTSYTQSVLCAGDSLLFNGAALTTSGIYSATYTAANGCDSTVILELTVLPVQSSEQQLTICHGNGVPFYGLFLTQSGTYTAVTAGTNGCDSTVILHLTVLPQLGSAFSASICQGASYPYNGVLYTQAGTYTIPFTASSGCDSLVEFTLEVLLPTASSTVQTICNGDSILFGNQFLKQAGTYAAIFTGANGCDSTVTLILLVNTPETGVTLQNGTLSAAAVNAFYQWFDCATNQVIPGAQNSTFTPTVSGSYAVIINQFGCDAFSTCISVTVTGVQEVGALEGWEVFPNPTAAYTTIRFREALQSQTQLYLFDINGRQVKSDVLPAQSENTTIDLSELPAGTYLVRLINGQAVSTGHIVKSSR